MATQRPDQPAGSSQRLETDVDYLKGSASRG